MYRTAQASCWISALLSAFLTIGCESSPTAISLRVDSSGMTRAIQACELPPSASVVAYVTVAPDRFLMTPDADGESASLTLTLSPGDRVVIDIEYNIAGESYLIARAERQVPDTGNLSFTESDFVLTDLDDNSVADCLELAPASAESARKKTRPVATADSRLTLHSNDLGLIVDHSGHSGAEDAACAAMSSVGPYRQWQLPQQLFSQLALTQRIHLGVKLVHGSTLEKNPELKVVGLFDSAVITLQTQKCAASMDYCVELSGDEVLGMNATLALPGTATDSSRNWPCLRYVEINFPGE
ncbi:MAG: hypothetical protein KTR32_31550 [Granulosicoccus sp.]|nr:hypothetical protein [Granulosicoccus sp.]